MVNDLESDQPTTACDLYFKRRLGPTPEEDVAASIVNILRPSWVKEMSDVLTKAEEKIVKVSDGSPTSKIISGTEIVFGRRQAAVVVYCPETWSGVPVTLDPPYYGDSDMVVPVMKRKVDGGTVYTAVFPAVNLRLDDSDWKYGRRHKDCSLSYEDGYSTKSETLTLFAGNVSLVDWTGRTRKDT